MKDPIFEREKNKIIVDVNKLHDFMCKKIPIIFLVIIIFTGVGRIGLIEKRLREFKNQIRYFSKQIDKQNEQIDKQNEQIELFTKQMEEYETQWVLFEKKILSFEKKMRKLRPLMF
jgi:septal ring factor EnvC (AmiA/AmiB activator)